MQLVDTQRYPIDRLDSAEGRLFVEKSAAEFAATSVLVLPRFLTNDALAAIAAEASALLDQKFQCHNEHNVFLDNDTVPSDAVPADTVPTHAARDLRARKLRTSVSSIANDHLDSDGALQRLYDWTDLTRFIGAVLGHDEFYCGADPLGALSINVYGPGDCHEWHFDESRFSVTLMVQEANTGGHFEYVSGLRSDDGVDADALGRLLDGDETQVKRLPFAAGSLSIFGGRNTVHRVTAVAGDRHRLVPVLTYDTVPGSMNSPRVRKLFWGRTG